MPLRRPLRIHRRLRRIDRGGGTEPRGVLGGSRSGSGLFPRSRSGRGSRSGSGRGPRRLAGLPRGVVGGREVPVATGFGARLLGLSLLDRADAGPGLLIPRCSSVHTFGMKFALDVHFLGQDGTILEVRRAVPRRRFLSCRGAVAVLEIPAWSGPPGRA